MGLRKSHPTNVLYLQGITTIGGAEKDLLAIINGINRDKYRAVVALPDNCGALPQELKKRQVDVLITPIPPFRKLKYLLHVPYAILCLFRLLNKEKISLMHVNDMWWVPIGVLASMLAGIPCVAYIRQDITEKRVSQYWLRLPQMLVTVSESIRSVLLSGGISPKRVMTVYSGIKIEEVPIGLDGLAIRGKYHISKEQPVVGTVANLFSIKGLDVLIHAIARLKGYLPDIKCFIVGNNKTSYAAQLVTMVKNLDLSEAVIFTGFQGNVYPYLAAFDVFVFASIREALGIALLEAMAMGKPVVASRVGGIPEIVEDGMTGILVEPGNSETLAKSILNLITNPEKMVSMGYAGTKRVEKKFTIDKQIKSLENIYSTLLISD